MDWIARYKSEYRRVYGNRAIIERRGSWYLLHERVSPDAVPELLGIYRRWQLEQQATQLACLPDCAI